MDDAGTWRGKLIAIGVFALIVLGVWYLVFYEDVVVLPPGVQAPDEPVQTEMQKRVLFENADYTVTALAGFDLRGKVLSRKRYGSGPESDFSPIDLALGWKRMSDQSVVDQISISQRGRWYSWRYSGSPPIPHRDIERCSANMHIVPADAAVKNKLLKVRKGEIVEFNGYLISITRPNGWHWNSSLSREDTRGGACEIVWVEDFEIVVSD